ncbi:hypothetical protein ACFQZ4_37430 [Catellatospora coxensis]|uniref:Lipoprotein n=1 Tax=Catellatospora coxensis TaxID=310354 RepID=A0A8J3P6R1_9ACTN|nr:hypothetical protein [Catellatospora coxensis]GIG03731.1 hypothetical protein Cco03nite_04310 [Catellatospora coxensis]
MRFNRRQLIAVALAVVVSLAGCAPPDGPSDEEILAVGTKALDAVPMPADWRPRGRSAERVRSHLAWHRYYNAPGSHVEVLLTIDRLMTEAGWTRGDDCLGPDGKCFYYETADFHVMPTATDTVCEGIPAPCSSVQLWMSRR